MAKKNDLSLPKVITDADKEISTIIEKDIEAESKLLKKLVDDVLDANMEIKKRNNERITDTRRKLYELNEEIEQLNHTIDTVDRETVVEQLNHMIDAENIIYDAKKQIRFFESVQLPNRLETIETLYQAFYDQVLSVKNTELAFTDLFSDKNKHLFEQQKHLTEQIISHFVLHHQEKLTTLKEKISDLIPLKENLKSLENTYFGQIEQQIQAIQTHQMSSTAIFSEDDETINIGEKVEQQHHDKLDKIAQKKASLSEKYTQKTQSVKDNFDMYYTQEKDKLEAKIKDVIEQEQADIKQKNEQLRKIKLLIIDAEKKRNYGKVQSLMREYDQIEKSKKSKVVNKTQKQLENVTKKHREKALTTLKEMKLKFEKDLAHQNYLEALAQIEFEEAKILYKIKQDRDSLQQNMRISKDVFNELTTLLKSRKELGEKIAKKRFTLRLNELDIMKTYEISEYTERTFYSPLLQELYDITVKRFKHLANEVPSFERMKCYQRYYVELQTVQFDFYQKIHQIDHQILTKQNQSIIEIEKQKEEINSEIIYQESLVSIAKKENELQRIKVNALYENERSLAEEQADRIELGIKVNDTFVKSTLENQLLFATQQIECAKSEYDIRLENIALTQEQEMAYAKRKIDYYSQKYEYEITQLEKERDHKLEDLEFKRLLFTDKKDNQKIEQSIAKIKASYQEKISRIEEKRENDTDIMRYQKVIDETNKRAGEAIEEAEKLKSETVDAFQLLYDQTKEKYDKIKTTKQTEATEGIVPLLNTSAVSSANDRLQKATIEADTLYKERIEIPQQEIKRLKSQLFEITEDHETEQFIESLKEQKTDLVETLNAQKEALKEALTKELSTIEETSQTTPFTAPKMDSPVRTEAMIKHDYNVLVKREEGLYKDELKTTKTDTKNTLKAHKKALKRLLKTLKKALKPYKKYIRFASKGLRAEKKELNKKHKRALRKYLQKVEDEFEPSLED